MDDKIEGLFKLDFTNIPTHTRMGSHTWYYASNPISKNDILDFLQEKELKCKNNMHSIIKNKIPIILQSEKEKYEKTWKSKLDYTWKERQDLNNIDIHKNPKIISKKRTKTREFQNEMTEFYNEMLDPVFSYYASNPNYTKLEIAILAAWQKHISKTYNIDFYNYLGHSSNWNKTTLLVNDLYNVENYKYYIEELIIYFDKQLSQNWITEYNQTLLIKEFAKKFKLLYLSSEDIDNCQEIQYPLKSQI